LRLEAAVLLEVGGKTGDVREILDSRLHLVEERLVEFEVLLFHVVETVAAVDEDHEHEHDVLKQGGRVDDDSHYCEYDNLITHGHTYTFWAMPDDTILF